MFQECVFIWFPVGKLPLSLVILVLLSEHIDSIAEYTRGMTKLLENGESYIMLSYMHYEGKGWLGMPDLWSGQKPRWIWYLTPVVNFGEVRRAQLAKSTLLTSKLVPLGSFKVCSDAKQRVGAESNGNLPHIQSLVKLQPWFLSLRWKTCLRQNSSPGSCDCSEGPVLGQNTLIMWWWHALYSSSKIITN